jgi:hypothetical protein
MVWAVLLRCVLDCAISHGLCSVKSPWMGAANASRGAGQRVWDVAFGLIRPR